MHRHFLSVSEENPVSMTIQNKLLNRIVVSCDTVYLAVQWVLTLESVDEILTLPAINSK